MQTVTKSLISSPRFRAKTTFRTGYEVQCLVSKNQTKQTVDSQNVLTWLSVNPRAFSCFWTRRPLCGILGDRFNQTIHYLICGIVLWAGAVLFGYRHVCVNPAQTCVEITLDQSLLRLITIETSPRSFKGSVKNEVGITSWQANENQSFVKGSHIQANTKLGAKVWINGLFIQVFPCLSCQLALKNHFKGHY